MQQYQIYQERKPRFKAMQFNGIADVEALRDMSKAESFQFTVDAPGAVALTLDFYKIDLEKSTLSMRAGDYLVIAENDTPEVLRTSEFRRRYEPALPPMAPPPAAPYPPAAPGWPSASPHTPR